MEVALRKESVDRNITTQGDVCDGPVALRKESVDRNVFGHVRGTKYRRVALRKESVDRNATGRPAPLVSAPSLSARRAWIEISVLPNLSASNSSLSARRAWIEIGLSCLDSISH